MIDRCPVCGAQLYKEPTRIRCKAKSPDFQISHFYWNQTYILIRALGSTDYEEYIRFLLDDQELEISFRGEFFSVKTPIESFDQLVSYMNSLREGSLFI
jgi:hypothetical protein